VRAAKQLATLLLAWVAVEPAGAQAPPRRVPADGVEYAVQHWSTADGLPQNTVTCIAQTADTQLWVGTFGGLARFDGTSFKTFSLAETPGLASIRILSLHAAPHTGELWIGTYRGGVVRRCGETVEHFGREQGLPHESVHAIASDGDERVWVSTPAGAAWFDGARFQPVRCGDEGATHGLARRAGGELLVGSDHGLYRLTTTGGERVADVACRAVAEDDAGTLWAAAGDNLLRRDPSGWRKVPLRARPGFAIHTLSAGRRGGLWLGTNAGPLHLRTGACADAALDLGAAEPRGEIGVRALHEDRHGNLWVGFEAVGLQRLRRASTRGLPLAGCPEFTLLRVVSPAAGGGLWLGGRGLARLRDNRIEAFRTFEVGAVHALLADADGSLWFSDDAAVRRLAGERVESFGPEHGLPGGYKRALLRDPAGALWVGTEHGVYRSRGGAFERLGAPEMAEENVLALAATGDGGVWAGGSGGLARFGADGGLRSRLRSGRELPPGEVRGLVPLPDGTLWCVTYGAGLVRVRGDHVASVNERNGLADDALCAAVLDGERLFLSSNSGLFSCRLAELGEVADGHTGRVRCHRFVGSPAVSEEGAGGNQPAACRDENGGLWFVTIDGLAGVDPRSEPEPAAPPACGIHSV
jgi:ligand-binding sensor domain-containing protein